MSTLIFLTAPPFHQDGWRLRHIIDQSGLAVKAIRVVPTVRGLLQTVRAARPPVVVFVSCAVNDGHLMLFNEKGSAAPLQPSDLAALIGRNVHTGILLLYASEGDFDPDELQYNLQQQGMCDAVVIPVNEPAAGQDQLERAILQQLSGSGGPPTGLKSLPAEPGSAVFDGFPDLNDPLTGRQEAVVAALAEITGIDPSSMGNLEKRELLLQAAQIQGELDRLTLDEKVMLQRQNIIDHWLAQSREAVHLAAKNDLPAAQITVLAKQIEKVAVQLQNDELLGESGGELAHFLRGVVAYLLGDPQPDIPPRYQEDWDDILTGRGEDEY